MNVVHIINPAAGKGEALKYSANDFGETVHITESINDAENFVYDYCVNSPSTKFIIYGGDGTINEVINGIMKAEANDKACISVVPVGTGNDFHRNFTDTNFEHMIDVIKYNDSYAVNMLNIGFDCDVVDVTSKYKKLPLVNGSLAYILGVIHVLCRPIGKNINIKIIDENDVIINYNDMFLLSAIANGSYCGGGFMAAPLASLNDGLLDIMVINKIKRLRFISLVGKYQKGDHMDKITGQPTEEFSDIINYYKCKEIRLDNLDIVCVDGEILKIPSMCISVIKNAIKVVP